MDWNSKIVVGLLAACGLLLPSTVLAQSPGDEMEPEVDEAAEADVADEADSGDDEEADEDDDGRPWSVGGGARMIVGQGSFVTPANDTEFADEVDDGSGAYNQVSMNIGISAGYDWKNFEFEGGIGWNQAMTAAAGTTRPYEGRLQDLELDASLDEDYEIGETGIEISPSAGLNLPTSTASRTMTLLTSLSAGVGISKTFFDSLGLSYSLGGSRAFHGSTSPVLEEDEIQDDEFSSRLFRPDGTEALGAGRFAYPSINTQWGMSHGFGAQIMFSKKVMMMANYTLQTSWTYSVAEDDEFAHERQCSGRCPSQMASGMVMVNYVLGDNLRAMGGITTMQRPKSADNKTFNFPFWNFNGAARNSSMFTVGINGSY